MEEELKGFHHQLPFFNFRFCFSYNKPHTLQSSPSGPLRHSGVSVLPHLKHAILPSSALDVCDALLVGTHREGITKREAVRKKREWGEKYM